MDARNNIDFNDDNADVAPVLVGSSSAPRRISECRFIGSEDDLLSKLEEAEQRAKHAEDEADILWKEV
jgi:hypothetical protein